MTPGRDHPRNTPGRRAHILVLVGALSCVLGSVGCTRVEPVTEGAATISDEVFVEAMVALRTSFALDERGVLAPGASDAILQEHGLTAEALETFVAVHGGNVPRMAGIWARIEAAIDSANGRVSEVEGDPDR